MIFDFEEYTDPLLINNNPYAPYASDKKCVYCSSKLNILDINDFWEIDDRQIFDIHKTTVKEYKEIHDLEDHYLNLDFDKKSIEIWLETCNACGWWNLIKNISIAAEVWQIWDFFYGCSGVLRKLDIEDSKTPIDEVSRYLIANYESRFQVNPRLFEEVVADVYKGLGYYVQVTGYSNDGGIDVVLRNSAEKIIGVQVKRYKNKIKVEQIRAFAGALVLAGYNRGIFVTTSDFQPGALKAVNKYNSKTLPITLINSQEFYDALRISSIDRFDNKKLLESLNKEKISSLYSYGWSAPMDSL